MKLAQLEPIFTNIVNKCYFTSIMEQIAWLQSFMISTHQTIGFHHVTVVARGICFHPHVVPIDSLVLLRRKVAHWFNHFTTCTCIFIVKRIYAKVNQVNASGHYLSMCLTCIAIQALQLF